MKCYGNVDLERYGLIREFFFVLFISSHFTPTCAFVDIKIIYVKSPLLCHFIVNMKKKENCGCIISIHGAWSFVKISIKCSTGSEF